MRKPDGVLTLVTVLLLLFGSLVPGLCAAGTPETIEVPRRQSGGTVILKPVIYWPPGNAPFGVVVVVNSSAGPNDVFLHETHDVMNRAGIAVAYLDTYTPRGITDTIRDHSKISSTDMAIDALHVAEVLRKDSRIRPNKVALQGQSKGGVTSLHSATREWYTWSGNSLKSFDGNIAFAPVCDVQFQNPQLASPLYVMLAEKDDAAVPGPCIKLFERMKSAGQEVTYEVVSEAVHSWSTYGYTRVPEIYSSRNCADTPLYYEKNGFVNSKDGSKIGFGDVHRVCGAKGAFLGGPGDKRSYVLEKAAAWLKQNGW